MLDPNGGGNAKKMMANMSKAGKRPTKATKAVKSAKPKAK